MKKVIIIIVLLIAGFSAVYFLPKAAGPDENKLERQILNVASYPDSARDISRRINELSPTPPAGKTWTVTEVEFVKNDSYAYVIYNDTHNVFRILLETYWKPYSQQKSDEYRVVATFEPASQAGRPDQSGWNLTNGQDLAKGRQTVKISPEY